MFLIVYWRMFGNSYHHVGFKPVKTYEKFSLYLYFDTRLFILLDIFYNFLM